MRTLTRFNGSVEPVDGVYRTPRGLRIAADAVSWSATRSGGPGGQHANTSDTAVTVVIDVAAAGLPETIRDRIVNALGDTVTGYSAASRSQFRNRAAAWAAALERLDEAAKPPLPPRRATRPSKAAVRKRLASKRHRAERKQTRQRPTPED
jgi:ribosome-associated protein